MVLCAFNCGCFQGLTSQRCRPRAKHNLIQDEAASYHGEDVQSTVKALHEVKQRQEKETQELPDLQNLAQQCAADDAEKLNHAELVGRLENAKVELVFTDSILSLDSTCVEKATVAAETEEQPEAAKEAAAQREQEDEGKEGVSPREDSNCSLDSTSIESPCATASHDLQDGAQFLDTPESLTQAVSTTAESPIPCRNLEEAMGLAVVPGQGMPDDMEPVAEGERAQVVLHDRAHDEVQMTPQLDEKSLLSEAAAEATSPKDHLKTSELDGCVGTAKEASGSAGFGHKALFASVAVVAVAVLVFRATSRSR